MKTKEIILTKQESLKLTGQAFDALSHVFYNKWTNYAKALESECEAEERQHRGGRNSDFAQYHPNAATVKQCARMFAVLRVAEYLGGKKMPSGKDYLHCQKSCFIAAGIVDEFASEVREAWRGLDLDKLRALDYCVLVKTKEIA